MGGTAGADIHLQPYLDLINQIARDNKTSLKIAVISGEVDKEYLRGKIRDGAQVKRLFETPRLPPLLSIEDVDRAERIQAQMGAEPIIKALEQFPDIDGVITGRALDVGVHMAYPLIRGVDWATAAHAAKVIECSSMACDPATPFDFVLATIDGAGFTVKPTNPALRCSVKSIAGHALYERENPAEERNPGGTLDVSEAVYEAVDDRTVRCSGATWVEDPYTVKLEGVEFAGYEYISICGIRDEICIQNIDWIMDSAKEHLRSVAQEEEFEVHYSVFGRDGVLGPSEPMRDVVPHEVGLLTKLICKDKDLAERLAHTLRIRIFMSPYPGRRTTAGSVAFPLQNRVVHTGGVYKFNIWHLLPLDDPCEPFPARLVNYPN